MMGKNGHFWHAGSPAGTYQTGGRLLGNFLIVKSDPVIFPMLEEFLPRSEAIRGLARRGKDENFGFRNPQFLCDCLYRGQQVWRCDD